MEYYLVLNYHPRGSLYDFLHDAQLTVQVGFNGLMVLILAHINVNDRLVSKLAVSYSIILSVVRSRSLWLLDRNSVKVKSIVNYSL